MTDDLSVALKSLIAVGKNEFLNLFALDLIEMNRCGWVLSLTILMNLRRLAS